MLGSLADAEDVVQDAWLRWAGRPIRTPSPTRRRGSPRPPPGLALDRIRTLSRRREEYVGPWLPEPVALASPDEGPEAATELAESMTLGFLVVLDSPVGRRAGRVPPGRGVRRALRVDQRRRGQDRGELPPDRQPGPAQGPGGPAARGAAGRRRSCWPGCSLATASGDIDALSWLLDTDVVLLSDGGAERRAARRPVVGAQRVARFLVNLAQRHADGGLELRTAERRGRSSSSCRTGC